MRLFQWLNIKSLGCYLRQFKEPHIQIGLFVDTFCQIHYQCFPRIRLDRRIGNPKGHYGRKDHFAFAHLTLNNGRLAVAVTAEDGTISRKSGKIKCVDFIVFLQLYNRVLPTYEQKLHLYFQH